MKYFVLVCLAKRLWAFAVTAVLVIAVGGVAIAQEVVKEKRGSTIKEDPKTSVKIMKPGASKRVNKIPADENQPAKILGDDGGTTSGTQFFYYNDIPVPAPYPINTGPAYPIDPSLLITNGSGSATAPPESEPVYIKQVCTCLIRKELWDGGYTLVECPDQKEPHTTDVTWELVYVSQKLSNINMPNPSPSEICSSGEYVSWTVTVTLVPKDGCTGSYKDTIVRKAYGTGTPSGEVDGLIGSITPCRGN